MASNIPISTGSGQASVATEQVGNFQYQQIKVVGGEVGSTSVMGVNPDRSINVSIVGVPTVGAIIVGGVSATITGSVVAVWKDSSVIAVSTGSVVAVPTGNQSVSGTVGASIIGAIPVQLSNTSVITVWNNSSVIAVVTGSVVTIPTGNQSVSGTVGASIIGLPPVSIQGLPSVVAVLPSIVGTISDNVANTAARVANGASGSLVFTSFPFLFNGGTWDRLVGNSSIGTLVSTASSSVITIAQAPSIVGTYAEDAASATGDKGLLVMGARNDTLSSVTSADGDYSSHVVGPAGELIAANAPFTKWVSGTASMLGGVPLITSVVVVAAQGASIFTYITSAQVANLGSASVLVGFYGGTSSLLAYTIAPAGGGSNLYFQNGIKTTANGHFAASVSGTASVYVSAQGFIAKI